MTPALPDILIGQAAALAAPQPPEAGGDYMAGRLGLLAMLSLLAAQEAERGPRARLWENAAIRALLERALGDYGAALGGRLAGALAMGAGAGESGAWSALDAENALLRRALITLHEAVETRGDPALGGEILRLYAAMAAARRLDLPSALA
jgi:hypothetical protein